MKKIIVGIFSFVLLFGAQNAFAANWNSNPADCQNTVAIANYTSNMGYGNCWSSTSMSADPGDTINVRVYYHNTSNVVAKNVRLIITKSSNTSTSHNFTGRIMSDNIGGLSGNVNLTISSAQSLSFVDSRWFPNQTSGSPTSIPNGQSASDILTNGILIGDVAPSGSSQGTMVAVFKVSNTVAPEVCTDTTATNYGGALPCTYSQKVCSIDNFDANPAVIQNGSSSNLSWVTSGCNSVSISGIPANVNTSDVYTVRPTISTTYRLNAYGTNNQDSKEIMVTVNQVQPSVCSIKDFYASPSSIDKGATTTLYWETKNCTSAKIGGVSVNASSGSKTYTPGATTTYTIVASNANNADSLSRTVTVNDTTPNPLTCSIKDFGANPTTINKGSSSTLYWETKNCTSVKVSGVSANVNGSKDVSPQVTTTYTLSASGNGSDSATTKIIVNQPDSLVMSGYFIGSPAFCKIPVGGTTCETTLSWNTVNPKGTSTVTKHPNQTVATGNSANNRKVSISNGTTDFYLYNSNIELDSTSASASCASGSTWSGSYCAPNNDNPTNNCSLTSFTVNGKTSDTVDYRETTTLAWTSEYCNSVSISPYVSNNLNVNDSEVIYPTSTNTYKITAYGNNNSTDTRTVKINVNDEDDEENYDYCVINDFDVDDRQIEYGDETNIEWDTEGCDKVNISNIGNNLSQSDDREISPSRSTTYTLTAYADDGFKQTRSLYVNVVPRDSNDDYDYCTIDNFSANQSYVNSGAPVILNWNTTDCSGVNISYIGPVSNDGSRTVYLNGTTNYLLTAYGRRGENVVRTVSVVVNNLPLINPVIPVSNSCAVTTVATNITGSSATLNGFISGSGSGNGYFEYGSTTSLGSRTQSRFVSNGASFSENISGLSSNGIYYYRFVADCSGGNGYGAIDVFRTLGSSVVRPVIYQGTTVVGSASPIMLKIENRYEAIGERDTIEYTVTYKNIGKSTLRNPILQVIVPEGITIRNASRGTYQEDTRTLIVELDDLVPGEEGVIYVQGYVVSIQESMAKIVSTALLVYTNTNGSQENAIAYVLNIPKQFFSNGNNLGAAAFFSGLFGGDCNLGLIGWLLLLILILLIILIIRRYFYAPRQNHVNPVYPSNYPPNYPPNQTH